MIKLECSISFLCHPGQYTDILRAQSSPLGEAYGVSSTPETGRLACTSAVSRFSAARGSTLILYARSYRHLGKCTVCHRVQYLDLVPHVAVYRYVRTQLSKCTICHRRLGRNVWRARVQYRLSATRGSIPIYYARSERRSGKCLVCPS